MTQEKRYTLRKFTDLKSTRVCKELYGGEEPFKIYLKLYEKGVLEEENIDEIKELVRSQWSEITKELQKSIISDVGSIEILLMRRNKLVCILNEIGESLVDVIKKS
jgi:hypothetical protein